MVDMDEDLEEKEESDDEESSLGEELEKFDIFTLMASPPKRIVSYIKRFLRHGKKEVGIVLDGPNILRKINGKKVVLREILEEAEKIGRIAKSVAVLSPDAPMSLIKALNNSGFEVIIPPGDVHVAIATEVMKLLKIHDVDVVIIGSRDTRCLPILQKVKEEGAISVIMGFEPGFAVALKNAADDIIYLNLYGE
ncbi:MAG: NYN domain-containing protein [Candidatus Njordarchaeia archaeon]